VQYAESGGLSGWRPATCPSSLTAGSRCPRQTCAVETIRGPVRGASGCAMIAPPRAPGLTSLEAIRRRPGPLGTAPSQFKGRRKLLGAPCIELSSAPCRGRLGSTGKEILRRRSSTRRQRDQPWVAAPSPFLMQSARSWRSRSGARANRPIRSWQASRHVGLRPVTARVISQGIRAVALSAPVRFVLQAR
jgi:hypothetical protein